MEKNDATDFLVSKKILKRDFTKFVHSWDYKEKVDLALLLEEFYVFKTDKNFIKAIYKQPTNKQI